MNKNHIDNFNKRNQKMVELRCRIFIGLLQLKHHPFNFIYILLCFLLSVIAWDNRTKLIPPFLPPRLLPALESFIEILLAVMLVIFLSTILKFLGIHASQKIEGQLVAAFDTKDLQENGYPILVSCKPGKEPNSKVMIFYSHISLTRWMDMKEKIEEETNMCMESIVYRNGKRGNYKEVTFLYGKKKGNLKLYDEELERELKDVD